MLPAHDFGHLAINFAVYFAIRCTIYFVIFAICLVIFDIFAIFDIIASCSAIFAICFDIFAIRLAIFIVYFSFFAVHSALFGRERLWHDHTAGFASFRATLRGRVSRPVGTSPHARTACFERG
jgi:hypothetical protein